jgi:hypothetical protein
VKGSLEGWLSFKVQAEEEGFVVEDSDRNLAYNIKAGSREFTNNHPPSLNASLPHHH